MENIFKIVGPAIPQTIYMVLFSSIIAVVFGMLLGIILTLTRPGGLREIKSLY